MFLSHLLRYIYKLLYIKSIITITVTLNTRNTILVADTLSRQALKDKNTIDEALETQVHLICPASLFQIRKQDN